MDGMIWLFGFIVFYFAMQLWILPKLGIPTCMSRNCSVEQKNATPLQQMKQEPIKPGEPGKRN
ncbi:MAG: hypothetical protein K2X29_08015 [Candidatus Obscuribacterales bacterium]|nr:hypothetical protein [Candidatus Obscuribacterales bacterium]